MSMHCVYGEDFNRCNTLYCSVRTPKQKSRDTPLITLGVLTKGNITPVIIILGIMINESQGKPKESQFAKMFDNTMCSLYQTHACYLNLAGFNSSDSTKILIIRWHDLLCRVVWHKSVDCSLFEVTHTNLIYGIQVTFFGQVTF